MGISSKSLETVSATASAKITHENLQETVLTHMEQEQQQEIGPQSTTDFGKISPPPVSHGTPAELNKAKSLFSLMSQAAFKPVGALIRGTNKNTKEKLAILQRIRARPELQLAAGAPETEMQTSVTTVQPSDSDLILAPPEMQKYDSKVEDLLPAGFKLEPETPDLKLDNSKSMTPEGSVKIDEIEPANSEIFYDAKAETPETAPEETEIMIEQKIVEIQPAISEIDIFPTSEAALEFTAPIPATESDNATVAEMDPVWVKPAVPIRLSKAYNESIKRKRLAFREAQRKKELESRTRARKAQELRERFLDNLEGMSCGLLLPTLEKYGIHSALDFCCLYRSELVEIVAELDEQSVQEIFGEKGKEAAIKEMFEELIDLFRSNVPNFEWRRRAVIARVRKQMHRTKAASRSVNRNSTSKLTLQPPITSSDYAATAGLEYVKQESQTVEYEENISNGARDVNHNFDNSHQPEFLPENHRLISNIIFNHKNKLIGLSTIVGAGICLYGAFRLFSLVRRVPTMKLNTSSLTVVEVKQSLTNAVDFFSLFPILID